MPEVVLPVCAPSLMQGRATLSAQALVALPLLQQSTRPDVWRQWFVAAGLADSATGASALAGPRYEQFSMTAAAAACGMGVALMPRLLIEAELARGDLVVANPRPLPDARYYYWVQPEGSTTRVPVQALLQWLQQVSSAPAEPITTS
jgi:LysR family glycine cleavage system transcriptional activator